MSESHWIKIRNAKLHNLRGLDLDLPRGRLTVLTGPSGAGKSTLALDTLLAESRRRFVQTLSIQARRVGGLLQRPSVDQIQGLPPAVFPQAVLASRSKTATLGTVSEVQTRLALLFARHGTVRCLTCDTTIRPATAEAVAAMVDTLPDGTRYLITFPVEVGPRTRLPLLIGSLRRSGFTRVRRDGQVGAIDDLETTPPDIGTGFEVVVDRLVRGREDAARRRESIETALSQGLGRCGIVSDSQSWRFTRDFRCPRCGRAHVSPRTALFLPTHPFGACPACGGTGQQGGDSAIENRTGSESPCLDCSGIRLRPEAGAVRVGEVSLLDLLARPISEIEPGLETLQGGLGPAGAAALESVRRQRSALIRLGLGHLPLSRGLGELSGGERRALSVAMGLGSGFLQSLYVFEHPLAGFEEGEQGCMVQGLLALRDEGNTVLVIDHGEAIRREADHLVALGPGSGAKGGEVVYEGMPLGFVPDSSSPGGRKVATRTVRPSRGTLTLSAVGAKRDTLVIPLGRLVVVTGPTGAGKSNLFLRALPGAIRDGSVRVEWPDNQPAVHTEAVEVFALDAAPLRVSPRAVPGSIVGALDEIRRVFAATIEAKARGFNAGTFSFNRAGGRCDACLGLGQRAADLLLLPEEPVLCPVCAGSRFRSDVLEVTYRGKNIADVLAMTIREAYFFTKNRPRVQRRLRPLLTLGLDYLRMGQPARTLSDGEAQRVRLAGVLAQARASERGSGSARHSLVILDEPTAGLHPVEVPTLLETLEDLLDRGQSVVVVENRPEVIQAADTIIRMTPVAGAMVGMVEVFENDDINERENDPDSE